MEFLDILNWILVGGGATISASWIMEHISWFQSLASNHKKWSFFAIANILGVSSYLILNYVPSEVLSEIAPYFQVLAGNFAIVFLGETFHKNVNSK